MIQTMAVLLNGAAQIEFNRSQPLPAHQAVYLDKMDRKMNEQGIDIDGQLLTKPDLGQKAQFISANLAHAIRTDNEVQAAAMTTWLAVRMPYLKQVKIREHGEGFEIELDFEHDYVKQVPVTFTPWKKG